MLGKYFRRRKRDEEAAREIASYIAIETDENIARGMAPREAHEAAVRKFGNATLVREEIYWMNTMRPIDNLWQDLRYAARLLLRDKGFVALHGADRAALLDGIERRGVGRVSDERDRICQALGHHLRAHLCRRLRGEAQQEECATRAHETDHPTTLAGPVTRANSLPIDVLVE